MAKFKNENKILSFLEEMGFGEVAGEILEEWYEIAGYKEGRLNSLMAGAIGKRKDLAYSEASTVTLELSYNGFTVCISQFQDHFTSESETIRVSDGKKIISFYSGEWE